MNIVALTGGFMSRESARHGMHYFGQSYINQGWGRCFSQPCYLSGNWNQIAESTLGISYTELCEPNYVDVPTEKIKVDK
jgi:hypothetical protein